MSTSYSISEFLNLFETLDFLKIKNIFKGILTKQLANKVRIPVVSRYESNQSSHVLASHHSWKESWEHMYLYLDYYVNESKKEHILCFQM